MSEVESGLDDTGGPRYRSRKVSEDVSLPTMGYRAESRPVFCRVLPPLLSDLYRKETRRYKTESV